MSMSATSDSLMDSYDPGLSLGSKMNSAAWIDKFN